MKIIKNLTQITNNFYKIIPSNKATTDQKIQVLGLNTDIKLHKFNETKDSQLMTDSKRKLREMMYTENRIYQNGIIFLITYFKY